jgi:hypothetical protein
MLKSHDNSERRKTARPAQSKLTGSSPERGKAIESKRRSRCSKLAVTANTDDSVYDVHEYMRLNQAVGNWHTE